MAAIFAVTFPFFALVLCGYVAARSRLLPLEAVPGLNSFVLYFALPCMLWRFGRGTPVADLFSPVVALVWLGAAALIVAAAAALARRQGAGWPDAAFGALVAAFPNTGFMGAPLLLALLGAQAAGPLMATLLLDFVVTTSACMALSQWGAGSDGVAGSAGGHGGAWQAAMRAWRGVLRNPMPWAILLGALASLTGLALPGPLDRVVGLLADAATPVALFTIGAVLARVQMSMPLHPARAGAVADVPLLAGLKLVAHPLLVWGLGRAAVAAGALAPEALTTLTLAAALPSASNVSLLAERFGADNGRIARIILWSTAAAFLSFSAAAALLRP